MYTTGQQLLRDAEMAGLHEPIIQKVLIGIWPNRNNSIKVNSNPKNFFDPKQNSFEIRFRL